jgi:hypothetical protein
MIYQKALAYGNYLYAPTVIMDKVTAEHHDPLNERKARFLIAPKHMFI